MSNFLTSTEITDLKAIRATFIVDNDLTDLKDFFYKNGNITLSEDKNINTERAFSIINNIFYTLGGSRSINGFTDAYILRIYNIVKNTDLSGAILAIKNKAFQYQHNYSFDAEKFIMNNNFDINSYNSINIELSAVNRILAINAIILTPRI